MIKGLQAIESHLLSFGGKKLYIEYKSDAYYIMKHYDSFLTAKEINLPIKFHQFKKHGCHQNSKVYARNHRNAIVYIGFGLDETGDWLLHSFCLESGYLIELTTNTIRRYVGFPRNDKQIKIRVSQEETRNS